MPFVIGLIALVAALTVWFALRPRKEIVRFGHVGLLYKEGAFKREASPGPLT